MRAFTVILFLGICLHCASQHLPSAPNATDRQNRRQGDWVIYFSGTWKPVADSAEAVFYRLIHYSDDKPSGIVRDYFRNGKIQFSGKLLEDRPEEVFDGPITWYYPSGELRITAQYSKGEELPGARVLLRTGEPADANFEDYIRRGMELSDRKKHEQSAAEFQRAIIHAEAFSSRESEEYALCADWLGLEYYLAGNSEKAIYYDEEFVKVRRLIHSQPDTILLTKLYDLGAAYKLKGDWNKAKEVLREFINLNARFFNAQHPYYSSVIQIMGTVSDALQEYDAALDYLLQAERIFKSNPAAYENEFISNTVSLGGVYLSTGRYREGEVFLTGKLKLLRERYGNHSEYIPVVLGLLARLHVGSGQFKLAELERKEQLQLTAKLYGSQSVRYADILGSIAEIYIMLGEVSTAEKLFSDARKIYLSNKGVEDSYPEFLIKLAVLYELLGNNASWLKMVQERNDWSAREFGFNSVQHARSRVMLANYQAKMKNWKQVIEIASQAKIIFEKHGYSRLATHERADFALLHLLIGLSRLSLFYEDFNKVQLNEARSSTEQSINYYKQLASDANPTNSIDAMVTLGMIYSAMDDQARASQLINSALELATRKFGRNNFQLIDLYFLIAKRSEIQKDYKKSLGYYRKALEQHSYYISQVFPRLSEEERLQVYERNNLVMRNFYGFAAQYHDRIAGLSDLWMNQVISQKGIVLKSLSPFRQLVAKSGNPTTREAYENWTNARKQLNEMLRNPVNDEGVIKKMDSLINEKEKALYAAVSPNDRSVIADSSADWREMVKGMGEDEAFVEIITAIQDKGSGYDSAYYALVVRKNSKEPVVIRIEKFSMLEGRAARFYRNAMKARIEDFESYNVFWKPISVELVGVRKIWLSAEGIYHFISPSTLINPDTGEYLVDYLTINHVPTFSRLRENHKNPRLEQITVFAHPDYGGVNPPLTSISPSRSLDLENFPDLPGTAEELNDLMALCSQNAIRLDDFEGSVATEEQLKKIDSPQALHIATHGYFLEPGVSVLQNANPLLRAGLLLAECQQKPHLSNPGRDDGVLTAYEAAELPLYGTDIVVLSACETGLGDVRNGEGVYGLQRAFFLAGAERVMMSLWKVDDLATRDFMKFFYEGWLQLGNIRSAHRYAQLTLKEKLRHPYFWGAFILSGQP